MIRSFTLIELLVVIIIIGIIVSTLSFNFSPNQLELAADQIIKDIRFAQSLALKDDKYQPFPENNTSIEENRSKYWFKQWWQIRFFANQKKDYFYEIFSDSPNNKNLFDQVGNPVSEFALDSLTKKYKTGNYTSKTDEDLNLSKYGIKMILLNNKKVTSHLSQRLLFDNYGNIYLSEGISGDGGDLNPLDKNDRKLLTQAIKIRLCNKLNLSNNCLIDKKHCIAIEISPTGSLEKSSCN